jgi:hypothetical protein
LPNGVEGEFDRRMGDICCSIDGDDVSSIELLFDDTLRIVGRGLEGPAFGGESVCLLRC